MRIEHSPTLRLPFVSPPAAREPSSFLKTMSSGLERMPPTTGARLALELLSNAASTKRYATLLQDVQATLRAARIPIVIADPKSARTLVSPSDLTRAQRRWLGQVALELFFTQIFALDQALLDLRPARLGVDPSGDAVWDPRPLYVRWEPRFLAGLRDVYDGFFLEQHDRLQSGLADLGLSDEADLVLRHLGEGNQRAVRFRADDLRSSLRAMSAHHASDSSGVHRSFAAFGLYLASLYDLLETVDLAFDVRSAFMRSRRAR